MDYRSLLYAIMREWVEDAGLIVNADRLTDGRIYDIVERFYQGGIDQIIDDSPSLLDF